MRALSRASRKSGMSSGKKYKKEITKKKLVKHATDGKFNKH